MAVKFIALVLPLGCDSLALALALGAAGAPSSQRLRLSLLFAGFEAAMPLAGALLGAPLGRATGSVAEYLAAGLVATLGAYLLVAGDHDDDDRARLASVTRGGLVSAAVVGLTISLDELTVGLSAGLLGISVPFLAAAVFIQAFAFTQLGLRCGALVGGRAPQTAERLAAVTLLGLGAGLLVERLSS
jgi:putative Mn2+ efflux pump MntP